MPEEIFIVLLPACFVGILLISIYLVTYLLKRHSLVMLYNQNGRDFRFVCELLRLYSDKNAIIKNPCLMKKYGEVSPRADAVIVGGGGVLVLTVLDEPGQYSTPASGNWSVWQAGEMKRLPNGFLPGRQYVSVLSGLLVKCGLSCPVINAVVLTDDQATIDSLHEANVMTAADLVPYVNAFCRRRALGRSGQEKLKKAIRQHHEQCLRQLSTSMAASSPSIFANTGELPVINEKTVEQQQQLSSEMVIDELFVEEVAVEEVLLEEEAAEEETVEEEAAEEEAAEEEAAEEEAAEEEAAEEAVAEEEAAEEEAAEEETVEEAVAEEAVAEEAVAEEAVAEEAVAEEPLAKEEDTSRSGATEEDELAFKTLMSWLGGKEEK